MSQSKDNELQTLHNHEEEKEIPKVLISKRSKKKRSGLLIQLEKEYFMYSSKFPGLEGEWYAKGHDSKD